MHKELNQSHQANLIFSNNLQNTSHLKFAKALFSKITHAQNSLPQTKKPNEPLQINGEH